MCTLQATKCAHCFLYRIEFHAAVVYVTLNKLLETNFFGVPAACGARTGEAVRSYIVKVCFAGVSGGLQPINTVASQLLFSELCSKVRRVAALWSCCR
jgi:hypothetical protein